MNFKSEKYKNGEKFQGYGRDLHLHPPDYVKIF